MTLSAEIQAVLDRTDIEVPQKRALVYDLKGNAAVSFMAARVGVTLTRGIFTVTLTEAPTYDGRTITFPGIRVTKNGAPVVLNLPVKLVNPPCLVSDGVGGFREDMAQAIRDVLVDLIR